MWSRPNLLHLVFLPFIVGLALERVAGLANHLFFQYESQLIESINWPETSFQSISMRCMSLSQYTCGTQTACKSYEVTHVQLIAEFQPASCDPQSVYQIQLFFTQHMHHNWPYHHCATKLMDLLEPRYSQINPSPREDVHSNAGICLLTPGLKGWGGQYTVMPVHNWLNHHILHAPGLITTKSSVLDEFLLLIKSILTAFELGLSFGRLLQ